MASESAAPPADEVSLTHGGPFYRVARRLHLELRDRDARHNTRALLAATALGWLPVIALCALDYLRTGRWDPLVLESEIHVRLLLSLSLLLAGDVVLELSAGAAGRHLVAAKILRGAGVDAWRRRIERVQRARDSWWPEATILGTVYGVTLASYLGVLPDAVLRWLAPAIHDANRGWGGETAAWWWYVLVGQPLFLFVVGRWLVRWALWARLLVTIARQDPHVQPAHADRAGGLAFLAAPLLAFRWFALALGFALSSVWFDEIAAGAAAPAAFSADLLTFVGLSLALAFLPYAALTPRLIQARLRGERAYGALVHDYVESFDRRWLHRERDPEDLLGHPDFSALADIGTAFAAVREMRSTVFERAQVLALLLVTLVPFAMVVFTFVVPPADVVKLLLNRVVG